jgi:hypothetical protein
MNESYLNCHYFEKKKTPKKQILQLRIGDFYQINHVSAERLTTSGGYHRD